MDSLPYTREMSLCSGSKPCTYLNYFIYLMGLHFFSYYLSVFPTRAMGSFGVLFCVLFAFMFPELLIFWLLIVDGQ